MALRFVPSIWYPIQFQKSQLIRALINSGSKVNTMTLAYARKLGLTTWKTSVRVLKIDSSTLVTYGIVIARFSVHKKLKKVQFFTETFLLADTSIEVVLGMLLLTFSDADVRFAIKELEWRRYSIAKALPTTQRFELINKREFVAAALD